MLAVMAIADAAVDYAALALPVVPVHTVGPHGCSCGRADCPSPGKHPRVRWQHLQHRVPSAEDVRRWWQRWPDANIGVLTGQVSGLAVLDVDPRNGGDATLAELERRYGPLPVTPEVSTGGGGRHLWFRLPADGLATGPLALGLDLKGEGGMVVVPPSVHASGVAYRWVGGRSPEEVAPAEPPRWLVDLAHGEQPAVRPRPAVAGAGGASSMPARTAAERAEFAEAWRRAGIELVDGDRYYRCPFHPDHHPSLHVDADGCRWYCFGCRRGGGLGALRHELGEHGPTRPWERVRTVGTVGPVSLTGEVDVDVVGESFHQDDLLAVTGGARHYGGVDLEVVATLIPDPDDERDPAAVVVAVDGRPVGWLRHDDAVAYRQAIVAAEDLFGEATCRARIRGGWDRGHGDLGAFGVVLRLPNP